MTLPIGDPVVDWNALLDVVWASLVGGVGVTIAYAIFILGATRAVDLRRDGHALAAVAYVAVAGLAFATVVAAVVLGIVFMTAKD
jgi:hypothetical protein